MMKQKFTMYVLNVYSNGSQSEWAMEGKEFEAELVNEGEYFERYDAPEFEVVFKPLLTRRHMPAQKWTLACTKDMHKWLEEPYATLEPDGVTATIVFKDEPDWLWGPDRVFSVLKAKCLDLTRRELAGAANQMKKAVTREFAAKKREENVEEAFRRQPLYGLDLSEVEDNS